MFQDLRVKRGVDVRRAHAVGFQAGMRLGELDERGLALAFDAPEERGQEAWGLCGLVESLA